MKKGHAHKSKKDYDRKRKKQELKKELETGDLQKNQHEGSAGEPG